MNVAQEVIGEVNGERRKQALDLLTQGELEAATDVIEAELASGDQGIAWVTEVIVQAMQADDLRFAGDLARITADLRYRGRLPSVDLAIQASKTGDHEPELPYRAGRMLSADKLRHDTDQLRHLRTIGAAGAGADYVIARYEEIIKRLEPLGPEARQPLSTQDRALIGDYYGRIIHLRDTPRADRALSASWDPIAVEDSYLQHRPGLVVIDDFLAPEALSALWHFCLESTVWHFNRYPHGRLGAFFDSGFNCPLLLQIAEEVRESFPRMIGRRHRLRQLWGFKYPPRLPADSTIHADFAAVNVNFWITPNRANRNPSTGGMLIYDIDAPREWDFATYNERLDIIKDFLNRSHAKVIYVPYRQNRAVIFNSDLFHATADVDFEPGYVDRRINVTMLYGMREDDDIHPGLSASRALGSQGATLTPAWRSAAFSRAHRRP